MTSHSFMVRSPSNIIVGNHQIFTDQFHGLEKAFCLAVYGLLKIKNDCEKDNNTVEAPGRA